MALLCIGVTLPAFSGKQPVILYTDIVSGPVTGGENGAGTYLSLFGTGFGDSLDDVKVLINGREAASYKYLGSSKGRPDIQQLSVQPGNGITSGKIAVYVKGQASNTNHTFTVTKGDVYFVSLDGDNESGRKNNINRPFRTAQHVFNRQDFGPGDTIVLRAGEWDDLGDYEAFLTVHHKTGKRANPMSILAYPGEDVFINTKGIRGGFNFYKTWGGIVIAGFRVNSNGNDLVQLQYQTHNIRVINNELFGLWKKSGGSAAISGNGAHWSLLGNHIHDIGYSKLFHGIYIDNDNGLGSKYIDIAYNHIHEIKGGRAIQLFWKKPEISDIRIHDNLIYNIDRDGIVVSDNTGSGIYVYNNIVYNTGREVGSGIRVYSDIAKVHIFNNTFHNPTISRKQAAIYVENAAEVSFYNNIVSTLDQQDYFATDVDPAISRLSHNLWHGSGPSPASDRFPINSAPMFVDAATNNFCLNQKSPAIDAGLKPIIAIKEDFYGNMRPLKKKSSGKNSYDLGACEYTGE
ncbi:MAG: right-handed parallel beta-helix repeat-containing protein [Gammaproteobacteria bacterium]|nr:right-handed parallel beta-helix repeat-containing protein [Gammaproteobacteria bacterium]